MRIDQEVRVFVAEFLDIPADKIDDSFDVISSVDWNERESDENIGELLEDFVQHFNIYVPERDYSVYKSERSIPSVVSFVLRPFFPFLWKKMDVQHLTILEMVDIAKNKHWSIAS